MTSEVWDGVPATTAAGIADQVRSGVISAQAVMERALDNLAARNPAVNAFVHVDEAAALAAARAIDIRRRNGEPLGSLAGVPFGVKDLEDCRGMPTRRGSLLFRDTPPAAADSPLVARLRAADAIPVGKTACSEMGLDSATHTLLSGTTRNPWDLSRTPGGSSGGSAAAVAAGIVPFATASDGGGSIRAPASFTGLVGLKPTHGRIAKAAASEYSVAGVLTSTVRDTARLIDVAAGPSPLDRTSLPALRYPLEPAAGLPRPVRAAWSADLGYAAVEPEVAALARDAACTLAAAAQAELSDRHVVLPDARKPWLTHACAQLYWELVADGWWPARESDLCEVTCRCVTLGSQVDAGSLSAAARQRAAIDLAVAALFEDIDVLMTPAVACLAFAAEGPIPATVADRDAGPSGAEPFGPIANTAWIPAISVPAGLSRDGLPVGLQLLGPRGSERLLLDLARVLERARPWPTAATQPQRARG